jgi:hypothetical protein
MKDPIREGRLDRISLCPGPRRVSQPSEYATLLAAKAAPDLVARRVVASPRAAGAGPGGSEEGQRVLSGATGDRWRESAY